MPLSRQKFNQGMTAQEYMAQIKVNKEAFLDIYRAIEVPAEDLAFFNSLARVHPLAVFTADWCGDALSTTPALLRLAEASDKLEVRVFDRDQELELTNNFLPEDRAGTVPVFVFFNSLMQEVAQFIETARELVPQIDAMDEIIARQVAGESGEQVRALARGRRTAWRVAHAREWGWVILHAFRRTVAKGVTLPAEQRPAVGGTEWPPQE